jgi:hypothetical protein
MRLFQDRRVNARSLLPAAILLIFVLLVNDMWLPRALSAPDENTLTDNVPVSLADAVKACNERASRDPIGLAEPPLTEDEVLASLRAIMRSQHPRMTDDVHNALQKVALTRMLPAKAKRDFTNEWLGYNGYSFTVWWIDLSIMTGDKTGYSYRLRDRKISSRPLTGAERQKLKRD